MDFGYGQPEADITIYLDRNMTDKEKIELTDRIRELLKCDQRPHFLTGPMSKKQIDELFKAAVKELKGK